MGSNWLEVFGVHRDGSVVAYGVKFPRPHGKVVLCWNTQPASTTVFDSMNDMEQIHGHGGTTFVPVQKFDMGGPE